MEINQYLNFVQLEAKHSQKLKKLNEDMVNNYENNIFPSTIEKYYQNKLSLILIQTVDTINKKDNSKKDIYLNDKIQINKELLNIEKSKALLSNYYNIVSNFFIALRKNQKMILYLLNNIKSESQNAFINYISLLFFENVFELKNNKLSEIPNLNEIVLNNILQILIEKELDEIIKNENNYSKFLDGTLASKIIKNLLKKDDIQKYLRNIFYDIITDITEMENKNVFMEPNRIRDYFTKKSKIQENLMLNDKNKKNINKPRKSFFPTSDNFINDISNDNIVRNSIAINNSQFQNLLANSLNNSTDSSILFDKNLNKTMTNQLTSPISYSSKTIAKMLYEGLTHSRLIYGIKEQKKFFNENEDENNCFDYYKSINIDEFLEIKEKNPCINEDYSKYELSQKELNEFYLESCKKNKYMEEFYYNQIKELQKDSNKNFSNLSFIKVLKKNYSPNIEGIIPQYKKNFEKIKYFIDKMIYKMLQNKNDKIPFSIRNIINIIYNYLIKKEKKSQIEINRYICEFFIGKIIIPFLTNEEYINLIIGKKIDLESKTFLFYFAKIIKKIFRSNFYDSFEQHFTIFNIYLCEILPYINLSILNLILSDTKNNNEINNNNENKLSSVENIDKIIKYDSIIINEKILTSILDCLIQNSNNESDLDLKEILSSDSELNEYFALIPDNYTDIVQQITQNNEDINKNDNNLSNSDNIFGGYFFILIDEEIIKETKEAISLSTSIKPSNNLEILPKIKYSLIKMFELIPVKLIMDNQLLFKNKNIIEIFTEIKNIGAKIYISDFINENNRIEKENQISFIWYLDYFLNHYKYLSDEYKENNFNNVFIEIQKDLKNEILLYQNDLSEYNFNLIVDKINEKIVSMDNIFNYYNQNIFLYKINNYISNLKIKLDIFEYLKDEKKFIYFIKLSNKDYKDITLINTITIENVLQFIKYITNHILNENILNNFSEIEQKSPKNFSQINNVNTFLEEYLCIIRKSVIEEIKQKIIKENSENNNIINIEDYDLEEKEKVKIERIMNIVEEIINEGIFKGIWDNSQSGEDIELNDICATKLANINPVSIGIKENYINEHIWQNIIFLMNTKLDINNYRTPMKKIKCIENIYNILNKSLNVITNKTNSFSVDDIFPIFVYLLIKIEPENLVTNLNYIKLLISKKNLIKSSGFALTQLEMAVQFLQNYEPSE